MIESSAPVRICDNGGWTDTWFGGPGRVLNMAAVSYTHLLRVHLSAQRRVADLGLRRLARGWKPA